MDIFEMTTHAKELAQKHQDRELIALMNELENNLRTLQEQVSGEGTKIYKPNTVTDLDWGHFTSNND